MRWLIQLHTHNGIINVFILVEHFSRKIFEWDECQDVKEILLLIEKKRYGMCVTTWIAHYPNRYF